MTESVDLKRSVGEAARTLQGFTSAASDSVPELHAARSSATPMHNESREVMADSLSAMAGSELTLNIVSISDEENENETDEETVSEIEQTQRDAAKRDVAIQPTVAERDEEESTDVDSLSENEDTDEDDKTSRQAGGPPLMKKQATLPAEALMDISSLVAVETDEETLLVNKTKKTCNRPRNPNLLTSRAGTVNHSGCINRRLGHFRQKSHSQPSTPLCPHCRGDGSPRSVRSYGQYLHNLSSHVAAVFRSLELAHSPTSTVVVTESKVAPKVAKKIFLLHDTADREHLLRMLLANEGNREASMPLGTVKTTVSESLSSKVEELNLDSEEEDLSGGGGTDTEEVDMGVAPVSVNEGDVCTAL